MYGRESWTVKKAECWRIDAFELWCWRRLFRVLWTARRSKQSILKEISPGCSLEVLMLRLQLPILLPPDGKNWLDAGKDPDAGKDWRQEEKGTTEDEMAGWHHWLNGNEFGQAPGVGDEQGGLTCCSPWGHKESDKTVTELNWTDFCISLAIYNLARIFSGVNVEFFLASFKVVKSFWNSVSSFPG